MANFTWRQIDSHPNPEVWCPYHLLSLHGLLDSATLDPDGREGWEAHFGKDTVFMNGGGTLEELKHRVERWVADRLRAYADSLAPERIADDR